jgi:hypothetical protein
MATATKKKNASQNGAQAPEATAPIDLARIKRETIEIPIVGLTPVIPHRWSEKAKKMMRDKQMGKPQEKKAPKDPEKDAEDATYWLEDGRPGLPTDQFTAAIRDAARFFEGVTMEDMKRSVTVVGDDLDIHGERFLVPVEGKVVMREDQPRNSGPGSTADLRHRNQIWPWKATLRIRYVPSKITREALVALVDAAGMNGVGDWRPSSPRSKSGTYGTWEVEA